MGVIGASRVVFLILAGIFCIVAVALSIAAVVTPAWQVVYISEFNTQHQHGLWLDCVRGKKHVEGSGSDSQHCTYKFDGSNEPVSEDYDDHDHTGHSHRVGGEAQHGFYKWHKIVLGLVISAILCGFIAICFALCASCVKICGIVFCVFTLISSILSMISLGVFFVNSHQVNFRFVHGISKTYEQSKGYSFWLESLSTVCFLVSFILGILATIMLFLHDRNQARPRKTWPKSHTSV